MWIILCNLSAVCLIQNIRYSYSFSKMEPFFRFYCVFFLVLLWLDSMPELVFWYPCQRMVFWSKKESGLLWAEPHLTQWENQVYQYFSHVTCVAYFLLPWLRSPGDPAFSQLSLPGVLYNFIGARKGLKDFKNLKRALKVIKKKKLRYTALRVYGKI